MNLTKFIILICSTIIASILYIPIHSLLAQSLENSPSAFEKIFGTIKSVDKISSLAEDISFDQFNKFVILFNRTYKTEYEYHERFQIFKNKVAKIVKSRADYLAGNSSFMLGINQFTDRTNNELKSYYTTFSPIDKYDYLKMKFENKSSIRDEFDDTLDELLNDERDGIIIDLRTSSNCIIKPEEQGECGSCYAFSATAVLESMLCLRQNHHIQDQKPIRLSVQQVVDCYREDKFNYGCDGGWPHKVLEYYSRKRHMISEACYPYKDEEDACLEGRFLMKNMTQCFVNLGGKDNSWLEVVKLSNEREMLRHLIKHGPFSSNIAVEKEDVEPNFLDYEKGIFEYPFVSKERANHAVTVVGAGKEKGTEFWIVKNSWGTRWGEKGFARIRRGNNAMRIEKFNHGVVYLD